MVCEQCTKQVAQLHSSLEMPALNVNCWEVPPHLKELTDQDQLGCFATDNYGVPNDKFKLLDFIARGAKSVVYRAVNLSTNETVALKIISKLHIEVNVNQVMNEVAIHKRAAHPNIVKLLDYFETDSAFVLVLEYVAGGELFSILKRVGRFSESDAKALAVSIATAISFLHETLVAHRDIKLENVVIERSSSSSSHSSIKSIKLLDFGLARFETDTKFFTPCGTKGYMAPEVQRQLLALQPHPRQDKHSTSTDTTKAEQSCFIHNDSDSLVVEDSCSVSSVLSISRTNSFPFDSNQSVDCTAASSGPIMSQGYSKEVDMWAFGCILYALMIGRMPFGLQTTSNDLKLTPCPEWDALSHDARDTIQKCLDPNPDKRCTARQFLTLPWAKSAGCLANVRFDTPTTCTSSVQSLVPQFLLDRLNQDSFLAEPECPVGWQPVSGVLKTPPHSFDCESLGMVWPDWAPPPLPEDLQIYSPEDEAQCLDYTPTLVTPTHPNSRVEEADFGRLRLVDDLSNFNLDLSKATILRRRERRG